MTLKFSVIKQPEVLNKEQIILDKILILSKILDVQTQSTTKMIAKAQDKIEKLLDEL